MRAGTALQMLSENEGLYRDCLCEKLFIVKFESHWEVTCRKMGFQNSRRANNKMQWHGTNLNLLLEVRMCIFL